jgi:hypothetical protein
MKDNFYILDEDEVVSVPQKCQPTVKNPTCTSEEFLTGIKQALAALSRWGNSPISVQSNEESQQWFKTDGVEGYALQYGAKEWQSGKLKLALVFCPDDSEEEMENLASGEVPLLEASLEPIETLSEPLDELRKLADET